jgi:hypothetical protein
VDAVMRRLALLLPAALLAALAPLAPVAPTMSECAAAGPNHAALVVEHGDGSVVTRCVAFSGASISGEQLLNQSGIAWSSRTFGGFGEAVCALDGEPVQYVDCPGKDRYWAVFVARGGPWQLASVGISTLALHDGDAEGFRYAPASGIAAAPVSAVGVCAAAVTTAPRRSVVANTAAAPPAAGASPTIAVAGATIPMTGPPASAAPIAAAATPPAAAAATQAPQSPGPAPYGGADLGLLLAAGVGGGLAGLAILRLAAGRRPGP